MKTIGKILILTLLYGGITFSNAQTTVAVADFRNQSNAFYLDSWERAVPEFLVTELSSSDRIIIVERSQLESVLTEQALSMTGLIDSATAQKVGQMLGAQFVITGSINRVSGWTRIDAKIIRVASGQVRSEKVRAKSDEYLNEMLELLANNLRNVLSGEGRYREKLEVDTYPTTYFLAATVGLAAVSAIANSSYNKKLDEYRAAVRLEEFDSKYDEANRLNKSRIFFAGLTVAALAGTIYCWINNLSPEEILANRKTGKEKLIPFLAADKPGSLRAGVSIRF